MHELGLHDAIIGCGALFLVGVGLGVLLALFIDALVERASRD